MKTEKIILYVGLGAAAAILLSKGKIGSYVGESAGTAAGSAVGGTIAGASEGLVKSIFIDPYKWSQSYKHYIPIIDDIAFYFARPELRGKISAAEWWEIND